MCFSWSSSRHVPWFTDEQQQQQQQTDSVFAHLRTERVFVELGIQNQHTAQTRRLRPHTHTLTHSRTHTNTNPSKHPLLRLSIPLCRHTEGDSVARLPWKPCRVYQPALPLADCGSHVFVCVCECGEWVCTCVGVCETVKPIQGSALSCWRGRQKIGYTCKKPIERRLALSPAIKATISVLTCRNTRRYFTR